MPRRLKGGDGEFFENAALIGLGAYAARNPNTPGMGIIANVGKVFFYAGMAVLGIIALLLIYAIFFAKRQHLTMQCQPGETPEKRDGEEGCRTAAGNWYAILK